MSKARDISCMDAARLIKHITGFQIAPTEIMWAEYDEDTKILKYEDDRDETLWQLNCCTGMSCHRGIGPGNVWTEWEHRIRDKEGRTMMDKGIQTTLELLRKQLNISGYKIKKIEAVMDWYHAGTDGREYCKEVAEITYENGHVRYADIGSDSNPAAVKDTLAVVLGEKKESTKIERIVRNISD